MIDFDAIAKTVKDNYHQNITDESGISKLQTAVIDAAVDTSIAVLREYEKQRTINS